MNGELKNTIENAWYNNAFFSNIPSFKIKYKIEESVHIDSNSIAIKIVERLTSKRFTVTEQGFDRISFTSQPNNLIWKYKEQLCLGGGKFEIIASEKGTMIKFKYFTNVLNLLIIATVFLMASVSQQASFITLVLGVFFGMIGLYQFTICKFFGRKMLREIIAIPSKKK